MPGHTFLYSPPVDAIRRLISSGELGDIYFISTSRVNLGLHQADVSVAWDLGPHDFSILRYWLGETPSHVTALSRGCVIPSIPDVTFINLEFPSAAIAHVELSWLAPSKLRRTTVVGSQKMVVYDDTSTEPVRVFDSGVDLPNPETFGEYRMTYRTGDILSPADRGGRAALSRDERLLRGDSHRRRCPARALTSASRSSGSSRLSTRRLTPPGVESQSTTCSRPSRPKHSPAGLCPRPELRVEQVTARPSRHDTALALRGRCAGSGCPGSMRRARSAPSRCPSGAPSTWAPRSCAGFPRS